MSRRTEKEEKRGVGFLDDDNLIKYCKHLACLKRLLNNGLIDEKEYEMILKTIKQDFGVVSNMFIDRK